MRTLSPVKLNAPILSLHAIARNHGHGLRTRSVRPSVHVWRNFSPRALLIVAEDCDPVMANSGILTEVAIAEEME